MSDFEAPSKHIQILRELTCVFMIIMKLRLISQLSVGVLQKSLILKAHSRHCVKRRSRTDIGCSLNCHGGSKDSESHIGLWGNRWRLFRHVDDGFNTVQLALRRLKVKVYLVHSGTELKNGKCLQCVLGYPRRITGRQAQRLGEKE